VSFIKHLSRFGALVTVLGVAAATFASAASASVTTIPLPGGTDGNNAVTSQEHVVRTVVVGGTPGWQIALIAVAAALVAVVAAVLVDRIRSARRQLLSESA
jgi:hypothetical protein